MQFHDCVRLCRGYLVTVQGYAKDNNKTIHKNKEKKGICQSKSKRKMYHRKIDKKTRNCNTVMVVLLIVITTIFITR